MIFLIFTVIVIFLVFPLEFALCSRDALYMCINSVIPSLFPFAVMAKTLVLILDIKKEGIFIKTVKNIFNISKNGAIAFILGAVCGYPIGAKTVAELYKNKRITKSEAKRLMCFVNNAGPAFTIATVGGIFLLSIKAGVIIYLSHIISSIIIGALISRTDKAKEIKSEEKEKIKFSKAFTLSVSDAVISVINVSGIIVFFSAFLHIFDIINLKSFLPLGFIPVFKGLFEMTGGIKELSDSLLPYGIKVSLSSFLISFSGASVFFQIKTFSEDFNILPVIISKFISALLAFFISFLFLNIL